MHPKAKWDIKLKEEKTKWAAEEQRQAEVPEPEPEPEPEWPQRIDKAASMAQMSPADEVSKLQHLMDMGYPRTAARTALAAHNGDLDQAALQLLNAAMGMARQRLEAATHSDVPSVVAATPAPQTEPNSARTHDETYRKELAGLRFRGLKQLAKALGATPEQIEDLADAEDVKGAAVELVVRLTSTLADLSTMTISRLVKLLRARAGTDDILTAELLEKIEDGAGEVGQTSLAGPGTG